jgi:hypothetical protein
LWYHNSILAALPLNWVLDATMTIEQLGSIGEFVAAIAVIVSLVYLAIQVKQHTSELALQSFRDVFNGYSSFRSKILENSALAALTVKAQSSPDTLTEEEKIQLGYLFEEYLFCSQQYFMHIQSGRFGSALNESSWIAGKQRLLLFLDTSYGRQWWGQWRQLFREEFVKEIDTVLETGI